MAKDKVDAQSAKSSSTLARLDDGTIQINFVIPFGEIKDARQKATEELAKEVEVPGFRKGNAPLAKAAEKISDQQLLEKSLGLILPGLLGEAITKFKLQPAIYPRFELIKAKDNEDWEVRAITCEFPAINLGDYKTAVTGAVRASNLWTPGKDEKPKEASREEKEQATIKALIDSVKVKVPSLLTDEEANSRLAKLLERLEKLGLNLESYLASIGKTGEQLRAEYEIQSYNAIVLDLILSKIAEVEKLEVDPKDIERAIEAGSADPELAKQLNTPQRKKLLENILKRRKALDFVMTLA